MVLTTETIGQYVKKGQQLYMRVDYRQKVQDKDGVKNMADITADISFWIKSIQLGSTIYNQSQKSDDFNQRLSNQDDDVL